MGALCLSNERVNRLKEASFPQRAGPDMNIQFSQEHQISWRTWKNGSELREKFLSAGAIQTPTGSVGGVGGKKKKPGDFACAVLLSRIPLQVKGSREVNKYSEERSQRAPPPLIHQRWGQCSALQRVKEQEGPTVSRTLANGQPPSFM